MISRLIFGSVSAGSSKKQQSVLPASPQGVFVLLCAILIFSSVAFAQQGTFIPTGSMSTWRADHTATLLNNGTVLVAGGYNSVSLQLSSAELYDPATGTFSPTGTMRVGRMRHTATVLNDGTVLVAGGFGSYPGFPILSYADLYNPATGTFGATGFMNTARYSHTATLLKNGMVLIAGGITNGATMNSSSTVASAELYNPATGTFSATGSMSTARYSHTATLLNNGTVLIAGGNNGTVDLASAELYDPATGTFSLTGSMNLGLGGNATLLNQGTVLVAGGNNGTVDLASAELYDPATGTFSPTGSMNTASSGHTATLLNNGTVLIAGGTSAVAELYDPTTGTFSPTGTMSAGRMGHTATLLNNGLVVVAGGSGLASAELYEQLVVSPSSLTFAPGGLGQPVGSTSAPQTVSLTNNESTALTITMVSISGTNASDFVETNNCVGSISAGAGCTINVSFAPTAAGTRVASLAVSNNLSPSPVPVPLTGMSIPPAPLVSLSSTSVVFGDQSFGTTSSAQTVTLRNVGSAILNIQAVALGGSNPGDFAIANGSTCAGGVSLNPNSSCVFQLTFTPTSSGTRFATVGITDDERNAANSQQTIDLSGTSPPTAVILVTPSTISFPSQYVGTSGLPQNVTLTNNGDAPLNITSVTASPSDFGTVNACGSSLAAGVSCAIGVFFDPTASGTRAGTLTINDNAAGSPHTVALSGAGQDFSMASPTPTATVAAGQTATYSVSVSPAGGFNQAVSLNCTGAPSLSTCTVLPNLVTLNGTSATPVTVTVSTTAPALILPEFPKMRPRRMVNFLRPVLLLSLLLSLILLTRLIRDRRETQRSLAPVFSLFLLVVLAVITLVACGGGGSAPRTPPGTYSLTVSGTFNYGSTTLAHNAKLTLVVQ